MCLTQVNKSVKNNMSLIFCWNLCIIIFIMCNNVIVTSWLHVISTFKCKLIYVLTYLKNIILSNLKFISHVCYM